MEAPNLKSDRLIYEPLGIKHLSKKYLGWMNDEIVIKHLESGGNYTYRMLKEFLLKQEKNKILFWAIILKNSKVHIGNIKIDPINKVSNSGEYGILIGDRNTWGEGYGYEASKKIINYCFNSLKLSQITLGVKKKNYAAINLYKKLGFNTLKRKGNQDIYQNVSNESIRMSLRNE